MKKFNKVTALGFKSVIALLISCSALSIYISSCSKDQSKTTVKTTTEQNKTVEMNSAFQNHVKTETELAPNDQVLTSLYSSDTWKTVPQGILSSIKKAPVLQTYDNVKFKAILFDIKNGDNKYQYNSLVVYVVNDKFLPVIIKSESVENGFKQVSISDLRNDTYLDFRVNANNKLGMFDFKRDIPFEKVTGVSRQQAINSLKTNVAATPTCMQSTSSFGSCMNCLFKECTSDWACAAGCAVEGPACVALFAASCGIAQI
ncbi:hypothetical protein D0C36_14250 [Mucilaginibacter conchicola]|uniref:Lipoprotein n=1 Tax=Mucilaginibacter conchicola TaxID=2303333 RepID=A0A372NVE3_9SPHI|nr:hypothetical protein [Mucilaginibacter conchicola]RFZ92577.1 hypothetical protein D0C36_14250 [Mucilaginibacter conchicola]